MPHQYGSQFADFAEKSFSWEAIELPAWIDVLSRPFLKLDYDDPVYSCHEELPPRILDLGCGSGRMLLPITQAIPDAASEKYIGLDISDEMIAAGSAHWPAATFIKGDVRELEHFSWKGELVVAHMFLHLLSDNVLENTIRRVSMRLNSGGIFAFCVPHQERINKGPSSNRSSVIVPTPWGAMESCHPRSARDYIRLLSRYHFFRRQIEVYELEVTDPFQHHPEARFHATGPSRLLIVARKA